MKNRLAFLTVLVIAVVTSAYASFLYLPVRPIGPVYTASVGWDSLTGGQVGPEVKQYLAADSLRIGQVVYISGRNTVAKSATLANYNALAGVVVGGARISSQVGVAVSDTNTLVATANQRVYVATRGRVWVLFDTGAGLAPGTQLVPSSKSGMGGRAATRTTAIDSFHRILGRISDTAVSGKAVLVNLTIK